MRGQKSQGAPARAFMFIAHPGDAADFALAQAIAGATADVVDAEIHSIHELKSRFPFNILFGISVLILSKDAVNDSARCAELVALFKNSYNHSVFRHFVIARDIRIEDLRTRPELKHFLDNVMVCDVAHLAEVEAEIRSFAAHGWPSPENMRAFQRQALVTFLGGLCSLLLVLVNFVSRLSVLAAVILAVAWYAGWRTDWIGVLAAVCAYVAGFQLSFLQPYELWTWLGRRWKLPRGIASGTLRRTAISTLLPSGGLAFWSGGIVAAIALAHSEQNVAAWAFAAGAVAQVVVDQLALRLGRPSTEIAASAAQALAAIPVERQSPTAIDLASANRAAVVASLAAYMGLLKLLGSVALRALPVVLAVGAGVEILGPWIVGPAIAGFMTLTLFSPARLSLAAFGGARGLTGDHTERMRAAIRAPAGSVAPQPLPEDAPALEHFAPAERADVMRWLEVMRIGRRAPFRPWLTPRDYAFISYAWAGEAKTRIAERVADACAAARIECFLDTEGVESKSGIYRFFLGRGLARATHVLLVVTPEMLKGTVVLREIETAMQRWPLERAPTIICVVEPHVAEALRADPEAPLTLRFLLGFCPQLSVEEASQPAIVRYLLTWTRRPGRLRDWLFLVSPAAALARTVSLDGVTEEPG